ncbi:unnamed protein product [Ranitomeya imitator]|uniref:Uncharacterized protein n=1 Tax=Ranitomeya imitator TaxID=111125 RepID=A0ABN9KZP9_9NEOB|nr:unnamed protein product [Ranitomeya imitator]
MKLVPTVNVQEHTFPLAVSLSCTPSISVIILYPKCQCHYPVPQVSASLSCTPSVSVIILYPKYQRHYPVPQVSVSLSCTPSVSVIILYPNVSAIILYPKCQCHYPVPQVSASLSCTPSVSVIILHPKCQCHYPVPQTSCSWKKLSCRSGPDGKDVKRNPPSMGLGEFPTAMRQQVEVECGSRLIKYQQKDETICEDLTRGSAMRYYNTQALEEGY